MADKVSNFKFELFFIYEYLKLISLNIQIFKRNAVAPEKAYNKFLFSFHKVIPIPSFVSCQNFKPLA